MKRFSATVSIEELKAKAKNAKKTKSTSQWLRVYLSWMKLRNIEQEIERLEPSRLDKILQQFYAEVKRKDGTDYEPSFLANMQAALDRRLREADYMYSLLTSRHFLNSRNVLEGKARLLREQGRDKRPSKSSSLSNGKIEQLWQSGQFGYHSPMALINTLRCLFTLHFGLRGHQEHYNMKIEDFTFKNHDGFTYVTFSEGITKTRQSGLREKYPLQIPKLFETRNGRCPMEIFRTYLAKRPAYWRISGTFYLAAIYNPSCTIWFKRSPMGVSTINNIMKNVISKSPLETSKHVTNHSARKTLLKRLKQNNVAN